jgi:xylulokinase
VTSAPLCVGIDSSTTSCKAIAWDLEGRAVGEGRAPIALASPEPDGWEQDAEDWWRALCAATRQMIAALGSEARRIASVCVASQRETFVLTDERGGPLRPALVWMDARCRTEVARAVERLGADRLHELSGKPPCTTPSLYKLAYLLGREPALRVARPRLCEVHGFVAWRLTDRFATSLAAADPTGLCDMRARAWSPELVALAGLDAGALPELVEPGALLGPLTARAAEATALAAGLPVIAGAGDGQAAGLGTGILAPGAAYLNLGTAVVSGVVAGAYRCDRAFRTLYAAVPGSYFLETDLQGGVFTLSWLVERLLGAADPEAARAALEREAARIAPGADGLMVVPYWNGVMNPYWDDGAAGVTLGWRGHHGAPHFYRAVLEGIALEERLHTEGVERAAGPIRETIVTGGGSKSALWCQILADVLARRVTRSGTTEATALGAGILAAVGVGAHASFEAACAAMTRRGEAFDPGAERTRYDGLYREVYQGLYPAIADRVARATRLRGGAA